MNLQRPPKTFARRAGMTLFAMAALMTLASCGGRDDGTPPPITTTPVSNLPPASASASTDGFIAFIKTLVPTMPETTMPLDVTSFVAPTSDTALPDPSI